VTITFLTYSSYTSQSIAVVTTAPVYLFIARQSHNASKFLIRYISAISMIWYDMMDYINVRPKADEKPA